MQGNTYRNIRRSVSATHYGTDNLSGFAHLHGEAALQLRHGSRFAFATLVGRRLTRSRLALRPGL
eukprot:scaffold81142_cov19-Prasinocladus_malaysianus.AAC.1